MFQDLCGANSALEGQLEMVLSNRQIAKCPDLLKEGRDKVLNLNATVEMLNV